MRGPRGFTRDIRVGEVKVWSILQIEEPGAIRAVCQRFIDDRAEHVRTAVREALAHWAQFDDSDLHAGSEPYVVNDTSPEALAHGLVHHDACACGLNRRT
ncbi:hypothetical protein [Paenarthrobacter sp. CAP02]|uniref:hypothetical protein n=1 Tax=Paenarthrobacter TaxID=1742992 RepID=UPI0032DB03E4